MPSNPTIITQLAHVDPNAAPLNINELIDIFNTVLTSSIYGSYIPYIIQQGAPGMEDTDKAWIELDSNGRPISIKTYYTGPSGGMWRRVYNGMLGEIRVFSGDPTDTTQWYNDGRGVEGALYDGWQICNGNNGAPDLTDKFIIGAHMMDSGNPNGWVSGKWQTKVNGTSLQDTGGNAKGQLTLVSVPNPVAGSVDNIPRAPRPDVFVKGMTATGTGGRDPVNDADLWGPWRTNDLHTEFRYNLLPGDTGNPNANHPTVDPVNILPPFIAYGLITFIGYQ